MSRNEHHARLTIDEAYERARAHGQKAQNLRAEASSLKGIADDTLDILDVGEALKPPTEE